MSHNPDPILPQRLKANGRGLGYPSQTEIELRATELAISDGRTQARESDLARAAAELSGGGADFEAPEASREIEELTSWDEPPGQLGRHAGHPLEDDKRIAEQLIESGLEEADHDVRVAAERAGKAGKQA